MKNKVIIILTSILFLSCQENKLMQKPFLIIKKEPNFVDEKDKCYYQYQDVNGKIGHSYDTNIKYNLGDTIK